MPKDLTVVPRQVSMRCLKGAKTMKKVLGILLAALILSVYGVVQAADKVRISVPTFNIMSLTAGVAQQRGFFKEQEREAEIIGMTPPVSLMALANEDLGYTVVFGSVVRGTLRGLPLKVIASFLDSPTVTLIAHAKYKSVKDLKGRTLGISTFGATPHLLARMIMKQFGIDLDKEVKVLALGSEAARIAALKQGIVDAVAISPPLDVEAGRLGFNTLARASELFSFPYAGLATHVKKIKERPDEVKRVLKALIKANRFIRENREGAIEVLAKWGRTDIKRATDTYDSSWSVFNLDGTIPEDGLRLVIEEARKDLGISREVSFSEIADSALLREAQRELGIRR